LSISAGLYNAFVPVIVYAAFGSSRQISIGPVAIIYAIVFSEPFDG
jgi:MFS superfamily sulfate permease-like transporter